MLHLSPTIKYLIVLWYIYFFGKWPRSRCWTFSIASNINYLWGRAVDAKMSSYVRTVVWRKATGKQRSTRSRDNKNGTCQTYAGKAPLFAYMTMSTKVYASARSTTGQRSGSGNTNKRENKETWLVIFSYSRPAAVEWWVRKGSASVPRKLGWRSK